MPAKHDAGAEVTTAALHVRRTAADHKHLGLEGRELPRGIGRVGMCRLRLRAALRDIVVVQVLQHGNEFLRRIGDVGVTFVFGRSRCSWKLSARLPRC